MRHFALFEALTIAILAMHEAESIYTYYEQWRLIDDDKTIDLHRRIQKVEKLRKNHYPDVAETMDGIQDLRHVRNQLVHALYPLTIVYEKECYATRDNDWVLRRLLSKDLTKEIYNIVKLYKAIQNKKLVVWLQ